MKRYLRTMPPIVPEQVRAQMLHIARDSIDQALAWEDRVRDAINQLAEFSGDTLDEDASDQLGHPVHKFVIESTHLIHFTIDATAGVVRVVNFRHGARLPSRGEP